MVQQLQLKTQILKSQFNQRLDQALVKLFSDYSRSQIKRWILDNKVLVNNKIVNKPKVRVFGNEQIYINVLFKENISQHPQNIPLDVIYEDEYILVINKPSNLLVHPNSKNSNTSILNALLYRYPDIREVPRTGIVHRLDKNTTGLMVIAKTTMAQINLVEALKRKEIIREYEAVVSGNMVSDGIVDQPISRHPIKRTRMIINPIGKYAITHYQIVEHFRVHTRLKLQLKTGRTHQIRVHMAHINHPLVGDPIYGNNKCLSCLESISKKFRKIVSNFNRQALHASMLRLCHPKTGTLMEWRADTPKDIVLLIDTLRADTIIYKNKVKQN